MPDVLYEAKDGIATLTLNRPDRLNAMGGEMLPEALDAIERTAADDDVKVLVLTGAGRGFCAGGDLSEGAGGGFGGDRPIDTQVRELRTWMRTSQLLHEMPKVTIAAVNGACAGAGFSWACACDLRFAAEGAKFSTAFLNAGLTGDFGGTWTLPRLVGPAKARELYLLSAPFPAAEAHRIGLVSEVLPKEGLMTRVNEIAAQLAGRAPIALRGIKQNLNDSLRLSFSEALDREAERHQRACQTEDATEAARAFIEKRAPHFIGR
ncbi:MAG: enoyl-CoA hydratase [Myxococcales bacterium]|nr:enoyl-CoA hydratase [Myxococcales bacterium]